MNTKQRETLTRFHDAVRLILAKYPGITGSQIDILCAVALKPGLAQVELAEEVGLTTSAVSRSIRVLSRGRRDVVTKVSLGLIRAERNEDDERLLQIYLTDNGETFVKLLSDLIEQ